MKTYQLTYLISPKSSQKEIDVLEEKIKTLVQEEKGSVAKIVKPTQIKLAYPIKGNREAFLADLVFLLEPKKLKLFEKEIKAQKEIIRYLLLVKPLPKKPKEVRVRPKRKIPKPRVKVELKEIEKKLEEILGE